MRKIAKTLVALFVVASLSSCSSLLVNEFAQRKYTNFKSGSSVVKVENEQKVNAINSSEIKEVSSGIINTVTPEIQKPVLVSEHSSVKANEVLGKKVNTSIKSDIVNVSNRKHVSVSKVNVFRKALSADFGSRVDDIVILILCFLIPPLAVYLVKGIGSQFWISLILTLLFWIPGIIYALIVCLA